MSAPQFTPGPWQTGHMMDGDNVWIGPDCNAIPVAYVDRDWQRARDEWGANARLIAAAPDLYAALKDMLIASQPQHTFRHVFMGEAQEKARAALAKARGETPQRPDGPPRPSRQPHRPYA